MQQRLPSLLRPPLLFAHRGARAHAPENTMAGFRLAVRLGATGLESDVRLTRDRVAVLSHDGRVGPRLRRRVLADIDRVDLPPEIPSLDDLLALVEETAVSVSLDVKDPAALPAVRAAVAVRPSLARRVFVCVEEFTLLERVATDHRDLQLVDSSRLSTIKEGPERRVARLAELGVMGLNMHHSDWNGGLVALTHRFERLAFAWDAQFEHTMAGLLRMGIDAIYSDWTDRMVDVSRAESTGEPY